MIGPWGAKVRRLTVRWLGQFAGQSPLVRRALMTAVAIAILAAGGLIYRSITHVEETDAQTAGEVASMASRVDGWLVARPVTEGDRVRKGQILARLDCRDAMLRLAALRDTIAATDAEIRETEIKRDTARQTTELQIADARAQLAAAVAQAAAADQQQTVARSDFVRADALHKTDAVSRESWEHAHGTYLQDTEAARAARAQIAVKRADLDSQSAQRSQVPILDQEIERLRRQRAAYQAQADQVRQEIEDRTLRAPFDGVIDRTFVHVGDYVQAGQWLLMLHDVNDVWVEANVKETKIARLHVGQPVEISVDAYPSEQFRGHVIRVGNAATNQFALLPSPNPSGNFTKITQRVPVRIALDAPPHPLQPGLMTEVSIDVAH